MKERPILFRGPMIRAILDDKKSQTRRVIKCASNRYHMGKLLGEWGLSKPPYRWGGKEHLWRLWSRKPVVAGDWVEEFQTDVDDHASAAVPCPYGKPGDRLWVRETWQAIRPEDGLGYTEGPCYAATGHHSSCKVRGHLWRPSIFMPREYSRLSLEVTDIRVERVQDISENDARAEGIEPRLVSHGPPALYGYALGFKDLWREINGAESWAANPWVWVVSFKMIPGVEGA